MALSCAYPARLATLRSMAFVRSRIDDAWSCCCWFESIGPPALSALDVVLLLAASFCRSFATWRRLAALRLRRGLRSFAVRSCPFHSGLNCYGAAAQQGPRQPERTCRSLQFLMCRSSYSCTLA